MHLLWGVWGRAGAFHLRGSCTRTHMSQVSKSCVERCFVCRTHKTRVTPTLAGVPRWCGACTNIKTRPASAASGGTSAWDRRCSNLVRCERESNFGATGGPERTQSAHNLRVKTSPLAKWVNAQRNLTRGKVEMDGCSCTAPRTTTHTKGTQRHTSPQLQR